jgi:hypothetical protein
MKHFVSILPSLAQILAGFGENLRLAGCVAGTPLRLSLNVPASPERLCTERNAAIHASPSGIYAWVM